MIPVLETSALALDVANVSALPAVSVEIGIDEQFVRTIGLIDPASSVSTLDKALFDASLEARKPLSPERVLATGFSGKLIELYEMTIRILGEPSSEPIVFKDVPVVVANLGKPMLILGRRGVLEWLQIQLDFPRSLVTVTRAQGLSDRYPALAGELPNFPSALELLESGKTAPGVLMLAWDLERFLDRLSTQDKALRRELEEIPARGRTLGSLLEAVARSRGLKDLFESGRLFANARNVAAHGGPRSLDELSSTSVLDAAERIVAEIRRPDRSIPSS
jgi:hypothetical protein